MPKLVITHSVEDVDTWLKHHEERAEAIGRLGGTQVVDLVAHDGSKNIAVSLQTDDVDGMMATLAAPPAELLEVMQRHGVVPPLTAYLQG